MADGSGLVVLSTAEYRTALRAAIRALWTGAVDYYGFYDMMDSAVRRHTTRAFLDGARECGIREDELSEAERQRIDGFVMYERIWINGFAEAIEAGSKENGGQLGPLFSRAEIWIGRYEGVVAAARAMACADKKLKWTLGAAEHCRSCLKLDGKVKRGSYWHERGILPRVHGAWYLECRGFRCQCTLEPTDDPLSKGPLPGLP